MKMYHTASSFKGHSTHFEFRVKVKLFSREAGKYTNNNGVVKQINDDSQFNGWSGNGYSWKEDLKVSYYTYLKQIYYSHVIRIVAWATYKPAVFTVKL